VDMIHDDTLDKYLSGISGGVSYVADLSKLNGMAAVSSTQNVYNEFDDGRIVGAMGSSFKELRRHTKIMRQLAARPRGYNPRYK
jgi:hypothetical protein